MLRIQTALFVAAALALASLASAGSLPPPRQGGRTATSSAPPPSRAAALTQLPGQTSLQNRTGGAVSTVCAGLVADGIDRGSSPVGDLLSRCQDMVQTGNALTDNGLSTQFDLGMNAAQTNDALVSLSHDEFSLAGVDAINIVSATFGVLESRLVALRAGERGINVAGLNLRDSLGQRLNGADLQRALGENSAAGSPLDERVGLFLQGTGNWGDFDGTSEEAAFDFDQYGLVAGGDFRFTEHFVAGAAFTYSDTDADFTSSGSRGSELDRDAYTGSLYASFDTGGFYADGILSYTAIQYELDRRILYPSVDRTAHGDTDADEWAASVGAGYNFHRGGWTFGPYLRAEYIDVEIDGFTEGGALGLNLKYSDSDIRSFTTDLGGSASYAFSTGFGVISPYMRAEWEHEYENDGRHIGVIYAADPNRTRFFVATSAPDRDYFNVGAGVNVTFARGLSAFVDFDTVLGLDEVDRYLVTLGGRIQF